jgi:CubicO group peptidase (beta-lactamase class C family)
VNPDGLTDAMNHLKSLAGADGISQTMVICHGRMIWRGELADSSHNVFSCTKSVLSMTAGLLVDAGKISLETRLCDVVPSMKPFYPDTTVRHALSLTNGYDAVDAADPFMPASPLFAPGTAFHYANAGFDMLALVLTKAAGEPLADFFKRRIGDPVGIDSRWMWGDFGLVNGMKINNGSGGQSKGICTSAENLARIGLLLLNNGYWNGTQLLSADWIAQATCPQSPANLPPYDPADWYTKFCGGYGFGFWVNGIRTSGKKMWPDAPDRTFAQIGKYNNVCFVIPEWDMVLVRMGADKVIDSARYTAVFAKLKSALI